MKPAKLLPCLLLALIAGELDVNAVPPSAVDCNLNVSMLDKGINYLIYKMKSENVKHLSEALLLKWKPSEKEELDVRIVVKLLTESKIFSKHLPNTYVDVYKIISEIQSEGLLNDSEISLRDLYALRKRSDGTFKSFDGKDISNIASHLINILNAEILKSVARSGSKENLKSLLDAGVNANAKDYFGWTPLMTAASCGNIEVMQGLITAKADLNATSNQNDSCISGQTALISAVYGRQVKAVEILLAAGADMSIKTLKGETARTIAVDKLPKQFELVNLNWIGKERRDLKLTEEQNAYWDSADILRLLDEKSSANRNLPQDGLRKVINDNRTKLPVNEEKQ